MIILIKLIFKIRETTRYQIRSKFVLPQIRNRSPGAPRRVPPWPEDGQPVGRQERRTRVPPPLHRRFRMLLGKFKTIAIYILSRLVV